MTSTSPSSSPAAPTSRPGRPRLLDAAGLERLRQALLETVEQTGHPLSAHGVAQWMSAALDRPVSRSTGWEYLKRLGYQYTRRDAASRSAPAAPATPRAPAPRREAASALPPPLQTPVSATRTRPGYPSDLTDAEWAILEPLLPQHRLKRPDIHSKREIFNALRYVARTGCAWRYLPHDFPPWKTVYDHFRRWRDTGFFEHLNAALREDLRVLLGGPGGDHGVP